MILFQVCIRVHSLGVSWHASAAFTHGGSAQTTGGVASMSNAHMLTKIADDFIRRTLGKKVKISSSPSDDTFLAFFPKSIILRTCALNGTPQTYHHVSHTLFRNNRSKTHKAIEIRAEDYTWRNEHACFPQQPLGHVNRSCPSMS